MANLARPETSTGPRPAIINRRTWKGDGWSEVQPMGLISNANWSHRRQSKDVRTAGCAGKLVGAELRSHDLGRRAATDAPRSGAPIEIVSDLSMTQRYLGEISDAEPTRRIENLCG